MVQRDSWPQGEREGTRSKGIEQKKRVVKDAWGGARKKVLRHPLKCFITTKRGKRRRGAGSLTDNQAGPPPIGSYLLVRVLLQMDNAI